MTVKSPDLELAKHLVTDLAARTWSKPLVFERVSVTEYSPREIGQSGENERPAKVFIEPGPAFASEIERNGLRETWFIGITLVKQLPAAARIEDIDGWVNVTDEIREQVQFNRYIEDDGSEFNGMGSVSDLRTNRDKLSRGFDPDRNAAFYSGILEARFVVEFRREVALTGD